MNEMIAELVALQKLQAEGSLDEAQTARLAEINTLIEAEKTAAEEAKSKELTSALAQKEHFREKFEKAESERKAFEAKLREGKGEKPALDVADYIEISASLEGLDQREKEYLAREHSLSGRPLGEIRKDENFSLWQSAYQQKKQKDNGLPPNGTQPDADRPISFEERLSKATSMAETEKILTEIGAYVPPKGRTDVRNIGSQR